MKPTSAASCDWINSKMLSVAESPAGEFDFCLVTGDIYRTGLYVFATETTLPSTQLFDAATPPRLTPKLSRL